MKLSTIACLVSAVGAQTKPTVYSKSELIDGCCTEEVAVCITRCGQCVQGQPESQCNMNYTAGSCNLALLDTQTPVSEDARDALGWLCVHEDGAESPFDDGNFDGYCEARCNVGTWDARDTFRQCYQYPGTDGLGAIPGQPLCVASITIEYGFELANVTDTADVTLYVESLFPGLEVEGSESDETFQVTAELTAIRDIISGAVYECPDVDDPAVVVVDDKEVEYWCEKKFPELPADPCEEGGVGETGRIGDTGCNSCDTAVLSSIATAMALVFTAVRS